MSAPGREGRSLLLLTRYGRTGASSRYRSYQHVPYLEERGFTCTVAPLFRDPYLEALYGRRRARRTTHAAGAIARRFWHLLRKPGADLLWIEKELIPFLPYPIERRLLRSEAPWVVDYDDALFHRYDRHPSAVIRRLLGNKIARVMADADAVVAGNRYLAEYARRAGASLVEILPTAIDPERYTTVDAGRPAEPFTMVWIGSPATARYLAQVAEPLTAALRATGGKLIVIGAPRSELPRSLPAELVPWSERSEAEQLARGHVGLMPMIDEPWARGKCGLKILQYMATRLPTIASPVGANAEIVTHGVNGFLAATPKDWVDYLTLLSRNPQLRRSLGGHAREIVERRFALPTVAMRLADLFLSVLENRRREEGPPSSGGAG